MFSFYDHVRIGRRVARRNFLRVGSLGLGGLSLCDLLAARAIATDQKSPLKDRSVIFLFMHGGPSQFETFDPKMNAPGGIRSVTGEIQTKIPGITFGSTFEKLAGLADKVSIVRSFTTGDGNHDIKPIVGKETLQANLGSLYARVAGPLRPSSGMPTNVALFPRAVSPQASPIITQFGNFETTGGLGSNYAPFVPGAGGNLQSDMTLNLPQERLLDRRLLLSAVDQWKRFADSSHTIQGTREIQRQAFETLGGNISQAFDLSKEDPALIARYDTATLLPKDRISAQWNNRSHYADNAQTLGKLLLLARRLCQHGAGFVTVTTSFVWDMHSDINNAPMDVGMEYVGRPFDHAVSAFIEDCEARGIGDKILLVCCGEMGRTPRINANGGRDHWGGLAPLLLYGGGLSMGTVVGQSSRDGGEPADNPVRISNLVATVIHSLLDVGQVRVMDGLPQSLLDTLTSGKPIAEILS